jgi:hypothetical protein
LQQRDRTQQGLCRKLGVVRREPVRRRHHPELQQQEPQVRRHERREEE